jgi:hypothetical protein
MTAAGRRRPPGTARPVRLGSVEALRLVVTDRQGTSYHGHEDGNAQKES